MDDIHTIDIPATVTNLGAAMFRYEISNADFTAIYIHDEKQKELDWAFFANSLEYPGYSYSKSSYNKETGVVSSASGDVKVALR